MAWMCFPCTLQQCTSAAAPEGLFSCSAIGLLGAGVASFWCRCALLLAQVWKEGRDLRYGGFKGVKSIKTEKTRGPQEWVHCGIIYEIRKIIL